MIILLCLILLFLKRMLLVVYAKNEFPASCTDSYVYCMCNLWVCVCLYVSMCVSLSVASCKQNDQVTCPSCVLSY